MKQTITKQKKLAWYKYGLVWLFLFTGIIGMQAQKVTWSTPPALTPATLTALGDPGYVDVIFMPAVAVPTAKVEITLPANYIYEGVENGSGHSSSATYGVPVVAGQKITLSFDNTLAVGQTISLRFKVSAACNATTGSTNVRVLTGATLVTDGQASVAYAAVKPVVRVTSDASTVSYSTQVESKTFELKLDNSTVNSTATSVKLTLTADKYTTLGTFLLDGVAITPTSANVITGSNSVTVITLSKTDLGGGLTSTVKKLKFSATNTRCGTHTIATSAQYPADVNCSTQAGVSLTMSYPAIAGTPNMTFVSAGFLKSDMATATTPYEICYDGVTPNWYQATYKNTGLVDAVEIKQTMRVGNSYSQTFNYIDESNVWVSLDGGATKRKVLASEITIVGIIPEESYLRVLKPANVGKTRELYVTIEGVLAPNATAIFYYPVVSGNIYDNSNLTTSTIENVASASSLNFIRYYIDGWNACGEKGGASINTAGDGQLAFPRIPGNAPTIGVRPNQVGECKLPFYSGAMSPGNSSLDIMIQLPSWMSLDGALTSAITLEANPTLGTVTDLGSGKYKIHFASPTAGSFYDNVILKYKAPATCPAPANQNKEGNVRYWLDWNVGGSGGNGGTACTTMPYFTQQYIPATLFCVEDGVVMNKISLNRLTRGLKDSNNNSIPDDGSLAPAAEINHSLYLREDKGELNYNMSIAGTVSTTYTNFVALISTDGMNLDGEIALGTPVMTVNGSSVTGGTLTKVDNTHYYFTYKNTTTPLKGLDAVILTVPFTAKTASDQAKVVFGEAYVTNTTPTDFFSPADRHGEDKVGVSLAIFQESLPGSSRSMNFSGTSVVNSYLTYLSSYTYNGFSAPYFKNEIRRSVQPQKLVLPLPPGYKISDDKLEVKALEKLDAPVTGESLFLTAASKTESDAGITYEFDLTQLYDLSYVSEAGGAVPASGKWMLPDDRFQYQYYAKLQASKGCPPSAMLPAVTTLYLPSLGGEATATTSLTYNYTGESMTLVSSVSKIPAYGKTLAIPQITVGNPNTTPLNNVWLYVVGDVSNLKLKNVSTDALITSGTGYQGRWLQVASSIASGATLPYKLEFDYAGSSTCDAATVTVYSVSGFSSAWVPTTTAALNTADVDHLGSRNLISITAAPATVAGTLDVSTTTLAFNTAYTLTASLDARSGQGSVKDAQMAITIPAGQQYVAGSAVVEYPKGTTIALPAGLEADLLAQATGAQTTAVTVNFKSDVLLPGFSAMGTTDNDIMILKANFKPLCPTALTGIYYKGRLTGTTSCGSAVKGNNGSIFGPTMYSNVTVSYAFDVTAAMNTTQAAFNEGYTTDKVAITVRRTTGVVAIAATDSLSVRLPKELNVTGNAVYSGFISGSLTPDYNQVDGTERIVRYLMPAAKYNADAALGVGKNMKVTLSLVYTPSGQDLVATPVRTIEAAVITSGKFDPSCPSKSLAIGNGNVKVALVTAKTYPYMACKNTAATPEITSTGFTGTWHSDAAATTAALATGAIHTFTPTTQTNTTFYLKAIFGGVNYGIVPMQVDMNPEATIAITAPAVQCSSSSSVDLTTTVGGMVAGSTVKYYSNAAGTTELIGAARVVSPIITTTYYARATTPAGCQTAITPIQVKVTTTPTMTSPTNVRVCAGSASAIALTGTDASSFSWTGGAAVGIPNGSAASAIPAFTALNTGATPAVATITVTPLNTANSVTCSGTPVQFTATVNPKPVAGTFNNIVVCTGTTTQAAITPTGGTAVTYYTWTGGSTVGITDNTGTGKTSIPSFTPTVNNGTTPIVATVTVTPNYSNGGVTCSGTATTFTYTINPRAVAGTFNNIVVCTGSTQANITPTGGSAVTYYTWTGGSTVGLANSTGTTNLFIPGFTPTVNAGATPIVATIIVTPHYTNAGVTCSGTTTTFTYTINPRAVAGTFSPIAICTGLASQAAIAPTGGSAVTYYTWTGGSTVGITDNAATGNTSIPAFTPTVNAGTTPIAATITVTPHYTNAGVTCSGTATTFTYTINPRPVITLVTNKTNDEVCVNTDITFTTESGKSNYVWNKGSATTTTSGATATSNTAVLQWNTAGTKTVKVNYENAYGCSAVNPTSKTITVHPATAITTQPSVASSIKLSNGFIRPNSTIVLAATTAGHNLTYQWYWKKASDASIVTLTNGGKYSGATTAQLTITGAYEAQNGDYYVVVTGTCGVVTSTHVAVQVANQDATLKDLKINGVSLADFSPSKYSYLATANCADPQGVVLGVPNFAGVTSITGNGTFSLNPGNNNFTITVVAQDMVTTLSYVVNVIRDCSAPKITSNLNDAVICVGGSHTFQITAEGGDNLTYEWYRGSNRILGANTNKYTISAAQLNDYDQYYVIVRNNANGFNSSTNSNKVRLWVADQLPQDLRLVEYPNPATVGKTHYLKVNGYVDVTKYSWSYSKSGVTFSPAVTLYNDNETWATFGSLSVGTGTLKVTMEHPCGTRELTQTITVNYPTGVDDVTATVVTVYPNPTSGLLKVSGTVSNQMIRVTDVTGSLKGSYKTQEGTTTIDLTGYAKGTYLVQYNGKAYKVIRK